MSSEEAVAAAVEGAETVSLVDVGGYEHLTDVGNSRRLVARHGAELRYCHPWRCWLVWDGWRWLRDDTGEVIRRAKDTVRSIYAEAGEQNDEGHRKKIADWAKHSEAEARIRAMISLARSEVGIPVLPKNFDTNPWLLNVVNGTIDLQMGKLRPHRREDLITKLAPIEFDRKAKCPRFRAFLAQIFDGNKGIIGFLRRTIGYALTGDTSEQVIIFLYGLGANGKTTLIRVILDMLGDYAAQTPTETLLVRRYEGIPNDVARLKGARFVSAVEAEGGRRLAEARVKQLTGGDKVAARFLRREFFEFEPTFKIFVATNHKPVIHGTDNAIWRRIRLVPFNVTIPPDEQDRKLMDKLRSELPGILAWAVRGCLEWQKQGLLEPDEVRAATDEYRAEMDVLGAFLIDCCKKDASARVMAKALYATYQFWCDANGEKSTSQNAFGRRLTERGFKRKRNPKGNYERLGLSLRDTGA